MDSGLAEGTPSHWDSRLVASTRSLVLARHIPRLRRGMVAVVRGLVLVLHVSNILGLGSVAVGRSLVLVVLDIASLRRRLIPSDLSLRSVAVGGSLISIVVVSSLMRRVGWRTVYWGQEPEMAMTTFVCRSCSIQ